MMILLLQDVSNAMASIIHKLNVSDQLAVPYAPVSTMLIRVKRKQRNVVIV